MTINQGLMRAKEEVEWRLLRAEAHMASRPRTGNAPPTPASKPPTYEQQRRTQGRPSAARFLDSSTDDDEARISGERSAPEREVSPASPDTPSDPTISSSNPSDTLNT